MLNVMQNYFRCRKDRTVSQKLRIQEKLRPEAPCTRFRSLRCWENSYPLRIACFVTLALGEKHGNKARCWSSEQKWHSSGVIWTPLRVIFCRILTLSQRIVMLSHSSSVITAKRRQHTYGWLHTWPFPFVHERTGCAREENWARFFLQQKLTMHHRMPRLRPNVALSAENLVRKFEKLSLSN